MGALKPPASVFTVTVRGGGIHNFRRWLKAGLRSYGLKVIEAYEQTPSKVSRRRTAQAARRTAARRQEKIIMDMRKYSGGAFLKVGDVKVNGPLRVVIVDVTEGKFDKPDLEFDDYTKLSVNATNNRILMAAYGWESKGWLNKEIELGLGQVPFEGELKDSILVKPISPPIKKKPPPPESEGESNKRGDMDDEIPSEGDESKSGRGNRLSRPRLVNS
jgi:hypothetical protein